MTTKAHKRLVAALVADGWRVNGWRKGVVEEYRAWLAEQEPDEDMRTCELEELADLFRERVGVLPDAWRVRIEGPGDDPLGAEWLHPVFVIEAAEAVVTHPVQTYREEQYAELSWFCDASGYLDFRLYESREGFPLRRIMDFVTPEGVKKQYALASKKG